MAERIIFMNTLPCFAYSFKNIAVIIPIGTEISRLSATVSRVVIIAG